jgi:hypothetical protein
MSTTPSKKIPGVPETISRDDYVRLIASVGLEPSQVLSICFHATHIEAVVFERDVDNKKIVGHDGFLKHTISIPVIDEKEAK